MWAAVTKLIQANRLLSASQAICQDGSLNLRERGLSQTAARPNAKQAANDFNSFSRPNLLRVGTTRAPNFKLRDYRRDLWDLGNARATKEPRHSSHQRLGFAQKNVGDDPIRPVAAQVAAVGGGELRFDNLDPFVERRPRRHGVVHLTAGHALHKICR